MATGNCPPDLLGVETADPTQLLNIPLIEDRRDLAIKRMAQSTHLRARPHADFLRDLPLRVQPTEEPFTAG